MLETTLQNTEKDLGIISNLQQLLLENDQIPASTLMDIVPKNAETEEINIGEDVSSEQRLNEENIYFCHHLTGGATHPGKNRRNCGTCQH